MDWPRIGAAVPPLVFCHGMTIRTPRGCISLDSGSALARSIISPQAVFAQRADMVVVAESRGDPLRRQRQNGSFRQAVSVAAGRGVAGGFRGRQGRFCDGEIKAARLSNLKPLIWPVLRRAARSERVPLFGYLRTNSTKFSAPCHFKP